MAGMYGCFKGRNSDRAAMASGPPDVMTNQEPAEVQEECPGKKKSKFQTFKKFFARKKRKEPSAAGADAGLKASQSSDNVSKASENNTLTRSEKDKGSGSKISLGSKALSHDSVFVSDSSEANEALGASQDSIHGKVKSLQLQLKQAIKLGSPPSLICVKGKEDAGTMSDDDGLPCSPPEYSTHHTVMDQTQRNSSISLERENHDDDELSCAASSRVASPLVVPGDFSQPASPYGCLDNSAAKHKMGLRHKACNKRKPANRLEVKSELDMDVYEDEVLHISTTEALVEQEKHKEVVGFDELKSKVEREEEEEEEEEEEMKEQLQHSTQSLLRDKEEGEEGEEELEAEQDVSHRPDASPPQLELTEEDRSDAQPLSSSEHSSTASSLDSARVTPEPPAGEREYLVDPACIAYGAEENSAESEFALSGEEDRVQESRGDESSLLEEVLSSLKTPLAPCSLDMEVESVSLMETVEVKEKERQEADVEEGEEMEEGEAEVDEALGYQAAPSSTIMLGQTPKEGEQVASPSCQEEIVVPEEEVKEDKKTEKKGEVVVERFSQHGQEEAGEKEEVKPEEENHLLRIIDIQAEEEVQEEYQSEGEEEAIELEKEPGVEEEGQEKTEEGDREVEVKEDTDRVEEAEEAIEEERDTAEEMTEIFSDTADEEAQISLPLQEADEGVDVVVGDDIVCTTNLADDGEIPAELSDEEFTIVQECQANSSLNSGEQREYGEETEEEVVEIEHIKQKEEDMEANQQAADQIEQESVEMSRLDLKQVEDDHTEAAEQAIVSSRPVSLMLPESHSETQPQESGNITPSKMSTTTIHINLVSPSSEKVPPFFQRSPTAAQPKETDSPSHTAAAEQTPEFTEEPVDSVEEVKDFREEATTPDSVEETVKPPPSSSDHSTVRFTITPAWQRSQSLTPPSSPPACVSSSPSATTGPRGEEVEAASKEDPAVQTDPVSLTKVELKLSPGRERNAGSIAAKSQSNSATSPCCAKLQTSAAASTEESSVIAEGNTNNPFGVRLRKTSGLHRLSSEEENAEVMPEPPVQPPGCKDERPQPVSVKPLCNKPALPRKPELHEDSGAKTKRISEHAAGRGVSTGSESPSWISVAKQKQKIYKENSLDEITVKKEEPERKSSLPTYISSSASNKKSESVGKVNLLEISKHSSVAPVEMDARGALSTPTPVPPQPSKSVSLPCSIPQKSQILPTTAKPPPQPSPARGSLSQPTPVPVSQKSPSCTSPSSVSKTNPSLPLPKSAQPQSTTVTSPPFSSRTTPESTGSRAPGQTPSSQRALPPPALAQDEPPWMALAKKKAKAWSEMPQIVQ